MRKITLTLPLAAVLATALLLAAAPAAPPSPNPAQKPRKAGNDPSPTLITLHRDNAPAKDVLRDLFDQIGFNFDAAPSSPDTWPTLTINAENQPFWQVARQINDALHTTIHLRANGKMLVNRSAATIPTAESGMPVFSGPCMLVAHEARHSLLLTATDKPLDCGIWTILLIEPHLRVAGFPDRVTPDLAIDENGVSLLDGKTIPAVMNAPDADRSNELLIALAPPENAGHKIARLKGTLHLSVVDQSNVLEIPVDQFADKHEEDLGGAAWTLSATSTKTDQSTQYRVISNLQRGNLGEDQWAQAISMFNGLDIQILDEKGLAYSASQISRGTSATTRNSAKSYRAEENAGRGPIKAGPAEKMRIIIPTLLKDVPIPFEFKDLPLP